MLAIRARYPGVASGVALALLSLMAAACRPWSAGSTVFPSGPITILVGQSAGGGYDLMARLVAVHLSRHLPVNAPVVVENLVGGGGLAAANHLARQAAADGHTLGYFGETVVMAQLMAEPGVQFDARAFVVIGSPLGDDADVCAMTRKSGFSFDSWRRAATPPRIGMTAYGSPTQFRTMLLASALGLPIKPVVGYQGTSQIRLAMESGEVDGICTALSTLEQNPLPPERFTMVLRAGEVSSAALADVPAAESLIATPAARSDLELLGIIRSVSRFFVVRAGTPPDRVAALRAALSQTLLDPEFLKAAAATRTTIRPRPAEEVENRIRTLLELPAERHQRLTSLLTSGDR